MKSEERHKLKSNELAESLVGIPDYFRQHGKKWIMGFVVVLLCVVASNVFRSSRLATQDSQAILLQSLVAETKSIQQLTAQRAQSGGQTDDLLVETYGDSVQPLENSLTELTQNSSGVRVAKTALLQKARLLRSRLFYADTPLGQEKRQDLLTQVETIYNTVLQQYPDDVMALGASKIGLALVAEDRLQWDQAKQAYQAILDDAQGQWAGTIFPSQAGQRFEAITEIEGESAITFEWVVEAPEADLIQDEAIVLSAEDPDGASAEVVEESVEAESAPSPEGN